MRGSSLLLLAVVTCWREITAWGAAPAPQRSTFEQARAAEEAALDLQATAIVSIARLQAAVVELEPFPHLVSACAGCPSGVLGKSRSTAGRVSFLRAPGIAGGARVCHA